MKPSKAVRRLTRNLEQLRKQVEDLNTTFETEIEALGARSTAIEVRLRRVEAFSTVAGSMTNAGELVCDLRDRVQQVESYTGKLAAEEISEAVSRLSARLGSIETVLARAETRMTPPRLSRLEDQVDSLLRRVQTVEEVGARDTARLAAVSRRQLQAETRDH